MKLFPDKLDAHLAGSAKPVYLLHGDEPYQIRVLGDKLRQYARASGFDEREVFYPSAKSSDDWLEFREAADSMSLFSEQRIIELNIPSGKPGKVGSDYIKQYCENPAPDVLLIIICGQLEASASRSAWFKSIDKAGATIAVWPFESPKLSAWIGKQLSSRGINASKAAVSLIADRVEGNMLAAEQEIERLVLLNPTAESNGEELTEDHVLSAVADSARFSINDLMQACFSGHSARAIRILNGLNEEAVAPFYIQWTLAKEIRTGARAAEAHDRGSAIGSALKNAGVWESRQEPFKRAMSRHNAGSWLSMLASASHIERAIKGQAKADIWDSLEALCVQFSAGSDAQFPIQQTSL